VFGGVEFKELVNSIKQNPAMHYGFLTLMEKEKVEEEECPLIESLESILTGKTADEDHANKSTTSGTWLQ
jgi:hypothetical protein